MTAEEIIKWLQGKLTEKRLCHTLGVYKTARALAKYWGANDQKAAIAALLHDCAKQYKPDTLRKKAVEWRLGLDERTYTCDAVLHAPVSAALSRRELGIMDGEILSAIRWHTTGCPNMTILDKIIYLADAVEPGRRPYPQLEILRRLIFEDLDQAMLTALISSINFVRSKGEEPMPDSERALDFIKAELRNRNKKQGGYTMESIKNPDSMLERALEICGILDDKKATDIILLDVTHLTVIANYFIISTGRSTPHIKALADEIDEKLGENPLRKDGYDEGRWVVLDYGAIIVHIFHEQEREFYKLERLWTDGSNQIPFEPKEQN